MKQAGLLLDTKFITKLNRTFKSKVIELGSKDSLYAKGHLKWGLKYDKYWRNHSLNLTFVIHECTWRYREYSWYHDAPYRTVEIYKGNHNRMRVRNNLEGKLRSLGRRKMKLWGADNLDVNVNLSFPSPPSGTHEPSSKG